MFFLLSKPKAGKFLLPFFCNLPALSASYMGQHRAVFYLIITPPVSMTEQKQEQNFADMQDDITTDTQSRQDNPGNFANDTERASEAGQKGGQR